MLKRGRLVEVPVYNFTIHSRTQTTMIVGGADIVIVEGLFVLWDEELRRELDVKVFTQDDLDTCLSRRIRRDLVERGRTVESVLTQYERFVKPCFEKFITPSASEADLLIPHAGDNKVAVDLVASWIKLQIGEGCPLA